MPAIAAIAATHYLIYSPGDRAVVPIGLVVGPLFLVPGLIWWSGVTLPAYCERLLRHSERARAATWRQSVHNYDSARGSAVPGGFMWFGAACLALAAGYLCAGVRWLHPIAWVVTAAALCFGALALASVFLYSFVSFPKWLRPKAHRCQVHRAGAAQNRATFIGLYGDPDDIDSFEPAGVLLPRESNGDDDVRRQRDVHKF